MYRIAEEDRRAALVQSGAGVSKGGQARGRLLDHRLQRVVGDHGRELGEPLVKVGARLGHIGETLRSDRGGGGAASRQARGK